MRLLFSVNNFGFLRNFEPALRQLAARGHDIHVVAERRDSVGGTRTIQNLQHAYPGRVTWSYAPSRKDAAWQALAIQVRLCLDYWRYLDPRWDNAPSLRARASRQAPTLASTLPRLPVIGSRPAMRVWQRLFRTVERAMPAGEIVETFLKDQRPDLLLLTPLLYFGSQQVEYVRAARALGIRTVLGVGSWDHLTTKGLIHERPDRVLVWNHIQAGEAADLHAIRADSVTVTGAQAYDHWFTQQPSTTRQQFCERVGVPADRPLLLYLCSSPFITPYEVGFVTRWIQAIRGSADPVLCRASILVRPHPQNAEQWHAFDPARHEAVGIWPRAGANPVDADARAEYFDSMYHSAAVVGVNTSALIESGIVGRPVYTVLTEEFKGQQEGTLHFQHLKNVNGGLLTAAESLDEHVQQLAAAMHAGDRGEKGRAFVAAFVRPHGLEIPAADRFVAALEAEVACAMSPWREPGTGHAALRLLLRPVAAAVRAGTRRRKVPRKPERDKDDPLPAAGAKLRILFSMRNFWYVKLFGSVVRELAARGHAVHLLAERGEHNASAREWNEAAAALTRECPSVTIGWTARDGGDEWADLRAMVRLGLDYLRFLEPAYTSTPKLAERARARAPAFIVRLADSRIGGSRPGRSLLAALLRATERVIPVNPAIAAAVAACQADALLITPMLTLGSEQPDVLAAGRRLGLPSALCVGSWDHLSSKALLRQLPDRVFVWNDTQKREAVELHGVPGDHVIVTGAQCFDEWFDRRPALDRDSFCRKVGLPSSGPYVLYVCSALFEGSPSEAAFVARWVAALRGSDDPLLRTCGVLVRPHPKRASEWKDVGAPTPGVAFWPAVASAPFDDAGKSDYFDSMYHAAAVVGLNTSALIESAIAGRPVHTVLLPEFHENQEGTLHFRYLIDQGLLRSAQSLEEHVMHLAEALHRGAAVLDRQRDFLRGFVRPHGLDLPSTPLFADSVESLAAMSPAPAYDGLGLRLLRRLIAPTARRVRGTFSETLARERRRGEKKAAGRAAVAAAPALPVDGRVPSAKPLRFLFVLGSPEYLRYYDSTMKLLADRGHHVMVAVNALRERKAARLALVDDARIEIAGVVPPRGDIWTDFTRAVRGTQDFVRYLHPDFARAGSLRTRMRRKVLPDILAPLDRIATVRPATLAVVQRGLRLLERAAPVSVPIRTFITERHPDAVIVSPLIDGASQQVDLVRAAQAAGVPTVAAIASWDNLTNKGHMRVSPDLVTVWNEDQRREAVSYHGVAPDRVAVTGAQLFDRWFDRGPSEERDAFCHHVGLPDSRPFVLFTGSSVFIARSEIEVPFVRRWIEALRRSSDMGVREAAVLIRPHPFNADAWVEADFSDLGPVAIWPRRRYTPAEESARRSFFDSLFHAAAVVGINTSAMIEAAILRKPVLSILTGEFAGTQEGTLHFHYLLPENGGFVRAASTLDAHLDQLSAVLHSPGAAAQEATGFVRRFLRPYGLSEPGTPRLADALERAARRELPRLHDARAYDVLLRMTCAPFAAAMQWKPTIPARPTIGVRRMARHFTRTGQARAGRAARLMRKRMLVHPSRGARRAVHHLRRRAPSVGRRALKQATRALTFRSWRSAPRRARKVVQRGIGRAIQGSRAALRTMRRPVGRTVRLMRLARYHAAVRFRALVPRNVDSNDQHR